MAVKAFTRCVQPGDWVTFNRWVRLVAGTAVLGIPADVMALLASHPACWFIAAEVNVCIGVIVYCDYMLYQRLICNGGDEVVVGMVVRIGDPSTRGVTDPDNDFTLDLLPRGIEPGTLQEEAQTVGPYGRLLEIQPAVKGLGVSTKGKVAEDKFSKVSSAVLHVEFEGEGYVNLQRSAELALAVALAALIVCVLPLPGGIALILGLAALAILAVLGFMGKGSPGTPADVDPDVGELHVNGVDEQGNAVAADIVYVRGTWIFDPLHDGWNELHPVKECCKVCVPWTGSWAITCPDDVILRLTAAFDLAAAPATIAAQSLPENSWTVHPDLDGCSTVVID